MIAVRNNNNLVEKKEGITSFSNRMLNISKNEFIAEMREYFNIGSRVSDSYLTKIKNLMEKNQESLSYVLVRLIHEGVSKEVLKTIHNRKISYRIRKEKADEIVFKENISIGILWEINRYLVRHWKSMLIGKAKNFNIPIQIDIEDYESEAFNEFIWAVLTVRTDTHELDKIKKVWSLYQHLNGYLQSMNRNILNRHFATKKKEEPIIVSIDDDGNEKAYVSRLDYQSSVNYIKFEKDVLRDLTKDESKDIFWDSWDLTLSKMNKTQISIVSDLCNNIKPTEIRKTLNLSKMEYDEYMIDIQTKFKTFIPALAQARESEYTYEDMKKIWC